MQEGIDELRNVYDEEEEDQDDEEEEDESEDEDDESSPREEEPVSSPFNLDQLDVYALAGFGLNASSTMSTSRNQRGVTSSNRNGSRPSTSNNEALATTPINPVAPSPAASTPGNTAMTPNTSSNYVGSAIQLLTHFLGSSNPNSSASDGNGMPSSSNGDGTMQSNTDQDLLVSSLISVRKGMVN